MSAPGAVEIKAFIPARHFEESKQFYQDLGFMLTWEGDEVAQFEIGNSRFLLQDHYVKEHADNYMLFLLVDDVEAWWDHIQKSGVVDKYKLTIKPPQDYPWGMREIHMLDPSGVFWHFGRPLDQDGR